MDSNESFKDKHKFSILAISLVALVITMPFAYSAVEPHILINMDASQTTNPIEIKDSVGTTIFTVDPSGVASHPLYLEDSVYELSYSILTTDTASNPHLIWEYDVITKTDEWMGIQYFAQANSTRVTGTGTCYADFIYSKVGSSSYIPLDQNLQTSFNGWNMDATSSASGFNTFNDNVDKIAFGFWNSDGATTCDFEDIFAVYKLPVVPHWTITKVFP